MLVTAACLAGLAPASARAAPLEQCENPASLDAGDRVDAPSTGLDAVTRAALAPILEAPERALIAFDVHGTVGPIIGDLPPGVTPGPETHVLPASRAALRPLRGRYGDVIAITGGPAADLAPTLTSDLVSTIYGEEGLDRLDVVTGHSARTAQVGMLAARRSAFERLRRESVLRMRALGVEVQTASASFSPQLALQSHYPGNPRATEEAARLSAEAVARGLEIRVDGSTLNVLRPGFIQKGVAIERHIRDLRSRGIDIQRVLYAGNAGNDLDAFERLDGMVAAGTLEYECSVAVNFAGRRLTKSADVNVPTVEAFVEILRHLASPAR